MKFHVLVIYFSSCVIHTSTHVLFFLCLKVGAKDLMDVGDRICLPKSVHDMSHPTAEENQSFSSEEERRFVQSLELYKV